MKNNKVYLIMYGAISLLWLASCVKDDLHNTPHPDKGAVALSIDWTATEEGAVKPGSFSINLRGTENVTVEVDAATPGTLPLLLPGAYSALMYNSPDGFSITTDDATVNKATDGNTLLPTPGVLFTGAAEFTAVADDTLGCVIPVVQRTRRLLFRLTVTDGAPERIASLSGTLSGVAGSIRLATGELSGAGSVIPAFTRSGAEITASLNLLGMTGTQRLTLLLTFTDGLTQTIESDLTEQLAHFNDSHTALEVSGTLKTPTAIQPGTSTITDWQVQEEKDITIN